MQKKHKIIISVVVAILVIACVILAVINRGNGTDKTGLTIVNGDKEITVAWEDIEQQDFAGELINGKGEVSQHEYKGVELSDLLADNDIEITKDTVITVTSEDNYSAELTGAEILEAGKVYVALNDDGEMIEAIDGGQGAQLIVFGDPNSKRAVRYLKTITIGQ